MALSGMLMMLMEDGRWGGECMVLHVLESML